MYTFFVYINILGIGNVDRHIFRDNSTEATQYIKPQIINNQ